MIVVKLMGGLGNQLFQYAFGKSLSLEKNCALYLDTSFYKSQNLRTFDLDSINHTAIVLDWKKNLISKLPMTELNNIHKLPKIIEPHFHYSSSLREVSSGYFEGYFQSPKYFEKNFAFFRSDFKPSNISKKAQELLEEIKSCNAISLHVRRGDYVQNSHTNAFHGIMPITYYEQSVREITLRSRVSDLQLFIFSDDLDWSKKNLSFDLKTIFIDCGNPITDLFLMSNCRHNIIANSTFSWWGAYLNDNLQKIVIAPKKWFQDDKINSSDLIPTDWLRI